MEKKLIRLSKFLSRVLRHNPEKIHLSLDQSGWAEIKQLIENARQAGIIINRDELHQVVDQNDKKRFSLSEDGRKIRANQGHSISVELGLEPIDPPEKLFHGTAMKYLSSIKANGLLARGRHHVHLSEDRKTAVSVGSRHGNPIVLGIKSAEMAENSYNFYCSVNGVWLTDRVPVEFLEFPPE